MIGRHLDKYEILEEVGHGGMAVVYKGRDTALKREVAIKVLHPHLASHEEARARFEREAQAVAKLRHENILEIFDYSGKGSTDSYIVTEFIRGQTLKEYVTKRPLGYPEIAAMIVVEVCRALAHAHSLGVLHRDVKPENIMIRDDGVLKLTDFGIAQVVDAQRMTMTGQLLGSPAYMSPEHVDGRPLDFRTDVFSVGILLYQLATNELPFKGRNPHEILKRIAECRYLDPRAVNPLVGDRLARIIERGLARNPDDRYPDVSALLDDLRRYLAEAGLTDQRAELTRLFAAHTEYEQALRPRLVAALTRRGLDELATRRYASALELFNRVLTIDPANERVLDEMDRLSHRRRLGRWIAVAGVGLALVAAGFGGYRLVRSSAPPAVPAFTPAQMVVANPDSAPLAEDPSAAPMGAAPLQAPPADAAVVAAGPPDANPALAVRLRPDAAPRAVPLRPDAAPALVGPAIRHFRIVPNPMTAAYSVDDGAPRKTSRPIDIDLGPGPHVIRFTHAYCADWSLTIDATDPAGVMTARCPFKPASLHPVCAGAAIAVNGQPLPYGARYEIPPDKFNADGRFLASIEFRVDAEPAWEQKVWISASQASEVKCTRP